MRRARDTQRKRLYAWEHTVPGYDTPTRLSLPECEALIATLWARYGDGSRPPRVRDGRGARSARGSACRITLPRWARTPGVIAHEVAHGLMGQMSWDIPLPARGTPPAPQTPAAHGPEYLGTFLVLLADVLGAHFDTLAHSAVKAGLRVSQATADHLHARRRARRLTPHGTNS